MDGLQEFSALRRPGRGGKRLAYLDSASRSQVSDAALDVAIDAYRSMNARVGADYHALGECATAAVRNARQALAKIVNAGSDEIVLTHGATEALNLVTFGWGRAHLGPDDEIAMPLSEHAAAILPWQQVARAVGAKLVFLNPAANGDIPDTEMDTKIGPRTKVVVSSHVSHVLGYVLPLERLAERAHAVGAVALFDCTHSLGRRKVDVAAFGADFAAFSGLTAYAPAGTGFLYTRRDLAEGLSPLIYGEGTVREMGERSSTCKTGAEALEAGGIDVAGTAALVASLKAIEELGYEAVAEHEAEMTRSLLKGLADNPCVKVYGSPEADSNRVGIVSFNYTGLLPEAVARFLDTDGVCIGAGTQGADLLMGYLGTTGVCRASTGIYTTPQDIDALTSSLGTVRAQFLRRFGRA